ncbi:MAG TPA: hypothetical protein VGE66_18395 [Chitinophagaceae bacterium]
MDLWIDCYSRHFVLIFPGLSFVLPHGIDTIQVIPARHSIEYKKLHPSCGFFCGVNGE